MDQSALNTEVSRSVATLENSQGEIREEQGKLAQVA
jgi:hypothetical protein